MKRVLTAMFIALALTGCMSSSYSESKIKSLTASSNYSSGDVTVEYRVYCPAFEPGVVYPVCIYLHDSSRRGSDGLSQVMGGARDIIKFANEDIPAIVFVPQCPDGHNWNDSNMIDIINDLVLALVVKPNVDPNRIYITGFGEGGEATWRYICKYPDGVATVAPVCGGPTLLRSSAPPSYTNELEDVNIWAVHYVDDRVRSSDLSKKILKDVWNSNLSLSRLTEFPSGGYTEEIYRDKKFLGWMFTTRRAR